MEMEAPFDGLLNIIIVPEKPLWGGNNKVCMYNNNSIIILYIIFNTFVHYLSCRLKALPGELHDSVLASLLGWYSN